MRASIEKWLLRQWYTTHRPSWFLRVLEHVYRVAYRHVQNRGSSGPSRYRSGVPLIVVGNITVGGSGKTPLVIRLCQLALDMNFRPGIASTGYGRQSADTLMVNAGSDIRNCGDEPVLLAERTGVPVVVAKRRCDAVKKLNGLELDLIFSDDGLQQADMDRDMEICVIDGARGLGNGHLLPAGPLREPVQRLRQVDYVITNGAWAGKPDEVEVSVMELEAGVVCSLDNAMVTSVEEFRQNHAGNPVHAFAGIGHPQRFFNMLEALGVKTKPHDFPDHHKFTRRDFDSINEGSTIVMTEKDAVKCRSLDLENAWYIPVNTHLPADFEAVFKDHLTRIVRESK
jgi:tetraacyldisaccharide 4'-kinase